MVQHIVDIIIAHNIHPNSTRYVLLFMYVKFLYQNYIFVLVVARSM